MQSLFLDRDDNDPTSWMKNDDDECSYIIQENDKVWVQEQQEVVVDVDEGSLHSEHDSEFEVSSYLDDDFIDSITVMLDDNNINTNERQELKTPVIETIKDSLKQSSTSIQGDAHIVSPVRSVVRSSRRQSYKRLHGVPKRPLSAYNFFFQKERAYIYQQQLKEGQNKIGFQELGKIIGKRWQLLTKQERKKFFELSDLDIARYREEMNVYEQKRRQRIYNTCRRPQEQNIIVNQEKKEGTSEKVVVVKVVDNSSCKKETHKIDKCKENITSCLSDSSSCSSLYPHGNKESSIQNLQDVISTKIGVPDSHSTPELTPCKTIRKVSSCFNVNGNFPKKMKKNNSFSKKCIKPKSSKTISYDNNKKNSSSPIPIEGIIFPKLTSSNISFTSQQFPLNSRHDFDLNEPNPQIKVPSFFNGVETQYYNDKKSRYNHQAHFSSYYDKPITSNVYAEQEISYYNSWKAPYNNSSNYYNHEIDYNNHDRSTSTIEVASASNIIKENCYKIKQEKDCIGKKQKSNITAASEENTKRKKCKFANTEIRYAPISMEDTIINLLPDNANVVNSQDVPVPVLQSSSLKSNNNKFCIDNMQIYIPDSNGISHLYNIETRYYRMSNKDADIFVKHLHEHQIESFSNDRG